MISSRTPLPRAKVLPKESEGEKPICRNLKKVIY